MKRLAVFPQVLLVCEHEDSPHPLTNYLLLLARQFHHFYDHHRVLGDDPKVTQARLALLDAVKTMLKLGIGSLRRQRRRVDVTCRLADAKVVVSRGILRVDIKARFIGLMLLSST